ncbi:BMP family ABC transporter substrate-binding protein [Streptomyces sp. NBC_01373]|uniref:BMP family ABC transporter substrate-binding protein n=1 Tax=Streptomyces sp. NBC_01373 TaxID=2903843 RepID=UPI0022582B29|nr:BMP family ABC transporter substrate-binding protein [Streptomyces sp. NBC_01373]MCX4706046.1 BMP family ABC transporter substrate-binding protein [Streptomyces sp. NBC_01373]
MTARSSLRRSRAPIGLALALTGALALSGCASNEATAAKTTPAASGTGGSGLNEPDVNGDGKVVIGVLSPGDINDHGYYESFVDSADAFAKEKSWTVIKRGSVPASDALSAARALCQQKVDMVALAASELKAAIPASEEPVCAKTAWYVPSSANIDQTPRIMLSSDNPNQSMLAAGYAAGLKMKAAGYSKAGFVTGVKADFSVLGAKAFLAGIREVVPKATLVSTYTGDFNDSAKAKEAIQAQISQGAKVIYPYLGGATDAAAKVANANGVLTLTPGTDRCDSTSPKFDISVIFSPGDYFRAALEDFAKDDLKMGTPRVWQLGVDPYPTVKICKGQGDEDQQLAGFMKKIGSKEIDPESEVNRLG